MTDTSARPRFSATFELPWQADLSVNHAYGRRHGRTFLKRDVERWRTQLAWQLRQHYHDVRALLPGRIVVSWQTFGPDGHRRDASNIGKVILDGVQAGLEIDDSAFETGECPTVQVDAANPRILVKVEVF